MAHIPSAVWQAIARISAIAWIAAFLLATAPPARGQQAPVANPSSIAIDFNCLHSGNPHRRRHECNDVLFGADEALAGDWNGIRRTFQRIGVTPTASYVNVLQTNVTGDHDQVWSYAGQLSFSVSADLHELIRIPGVSAYVGISWGTGSNLATSLDSTIPTSGLYAPSFYLGEMYLQEKLLAGKLTLLAGRLAAANSFATLPVFANYVDYGIDPNPFSLGANDLTFFGPPTGTEWGSQASCVVTPSIRIAAGAFNTNLNSANGENHGADFTFQEGNKGVLGAVEIDYLRNQRAKSIGKPGQLAIGFLRSSNAFPLLAEPQRQSEGYSGIYIMGQQMVLRPGGPGTSRGATVWGSWSLNSKDLVSPIPIFWGAGISYEGIIPKRRNDTVSVGLVDARSSRYAQPTNTEQLLELNYQWSHSSYLTVTPHAQYLWKRDRTDGRNATILGMQISLTL